MKSTVLNKSVINILNNEAPDLRKTERKTIILIVLNTKPSVIDRVSCFFY